jgi:hypothetical protein
VKEMIGHAFGKYVLLTIHRDAKTILRDPIIDVITREKLSHVECGFSVKICRLPLASTPLTSRFKSSIIMQTSIGPCHVNPVIGG